MSRAIFVIGLTAGLLAAGRVATADERVDFARQVQPLLTRACVGCHGPEKHKSGYRVDVREIALKGGDLYGPNIIPGDGEKSPLLSFVRGDGDLTMPPEGPSLTSAEVALLKTWIDQGAEWPDALAGKVENKADWWSLKPLAAARPAAQHAGASGNAVDAFIRERLARDGFAPSPPADRATLMRRVYFDLAGLPPTPEELAAFVADLNPLAYDELVDRLLASPRFGERWARHWMDAVHFAETHGHDQDRIRENAWPYRDYLIASFNADKPFKRFVEEQVAGDALYPNDPQATVALGFLAAGPWDESSLRDIREDTIDRQIGRYLDRDDMIGSVMLTLTSQTAQCARCHDHKFDAISQADYYALQAVFSGVERANRTYDADPAVQRQRHVLSDRRRSLEARDPALLASLASIEHRRATDAWEQGLRQRATEWRSLEIETATSAGGATLTKLDDRSVLAGGTRPDTDTYTLVAALPAGEVTAVRLETLADDSLPMHGPGRCDNGNLHLSELQVFVEGSDTPLALVAPSADFNQEAWGIERAIDGNPLTAWGIYPQVGKDHGAAFELVQPLSLAAPVKLRFVVQQLHGGGHLIGRVRVSVTGQPKPVRVDAIPEPLAAIMNKPFAERSADEQQTLAVAYERERIEYEIAALPPQSRIYAAAGDFEPEGGLKPPPGPRPIHLLHRGDIRNPREEATPGTLSSIAGLPGRFEVKPGEHESVRRAALARWLTDEHNPLIYRSMANRVWQTHFGVGLSNTANDFGHLGEKPSHPELLDYLATELRSGQSLKALHRLLVTSDTYRQTAHVVDAQRRDASPLLTDHDNRLLWRMNRTRLDAECVRDAMLQASGELDLRMGGPSDRQFDLQPGIHVTPRIDYAKFSLEQPAARRRSVYRFLFRTLPDPWMEALDCPSGDQFISVRSNSVTVQQALAMWNDVLVLHECERVAARVVVEAEAPAARVERLCQLLLGRCATPAEAPEFEQYAAKHGWANLARLLINSNEFLFVD